ncbi:MAG: hypothetical protein NUV55_04175 [Sulfuricaulis sp.]|uniref:hypothetical protein n=1 Tax=Sulfuricaulis sp. TaxID=2003553 RepID=UPI0025CB8609|nr:hypothetical protein [Sulfuricaulis sp.]MCR4346394.1 hypothetical protein [Sulfuricaulis sp.]
MFAIRIIGILLLLLTAGCVGVERAPQQTGALPDAPVTAKPPVSESISRNEVPETQAPVIPPPSPAVAPQKKPSATTASVKSPASAPALDLTALETRLKETKAIGVFTKITLKNQVDDLLEQFRGYYQGRVKTTLSELRPPYDRLLLKVLSLCQDGDPELARAIVASREAIWGILADPAKFATL